MSVCDKLVWLNRQSQSQRHRQLQRKVASDYFYSQGNYRVLIKSVHSFFFTEPKY